MAAWALLAALVLAGPRGTVAASSRPLTGIRLWPS
jgi:hypothetical protein